MTKIVFFTGAGMSAESGLPIFRGQGGIWDEIDANAVASKSAWYCGRYSDAAERRQRVLDFVNPIRRMILEKKPNKGHELIASCEELADVTVITQNGDDFHERAGSTKVLHLHGEALKNCSTLHPYEPIDIDRNNPDIHIGDKAPDGSQLRPYVIFFDEDLDKRIWKQAVEATKEADYFVVVGSSLKVFPAVDLLGMIKPSCLLVIIDPEDVELPTSVANRHHKAIIKDNALVGLFRLYAEFNLREPINLQSYNIKIAKDKKRTEIKELIEKLKSSASNEKIFFPWEDVYASMLKGPDKVTAAKKVCPNCGQPLVRLYFTSPKWTWQHLCGRAGTMLICPSCATQVDFALKIMN